MGTLRRLAAWLPALALALLALVQLDGLGASWTASIPHGADEDWDWQLSLWEAGRQALHHGLLPGWNPYTAGGLPLWAHPESPVAYPLWWLTLGGSSDLAMKLVLAAHLVLLALGASLAGRELGLGALTAPLGGLFVCCSAFLPEFIAYGHVMFVAVGWLPLAWVASRRGRWGWAGVALAMTALAGAPYLFLYGVLWLVVDALGRALDPGRLRLLVGVLVLDGLCIGLPWLRWPLLVALGVALASQRFRDDGPLRGLVGALAVAALVALPKLGPMTLLFGRVDRLSLATTRSVADPYTLADALQVLAGWVERPSGHEGPNVLFSAIPVALGLFGLLGWAWRRPAAGLVAWVFWCCAWGGVTPFNVLELVHRLPGFSLLRVVERYSLIWTLWLGWGAGAVIEAGWRRARPLGLVLALPLVLWAPGAARDAAAREHLGPGPTVSPTPGDFVQVREETSNYHGILANHGRPDRSTSAAPASPAAGLRAVGEPGYRGEVWLRETGEAVSARLEPGRIAVTLPRAGTLVINQTAWPGWETDVGTVGAEDGLLTVQAPAGPLTLRYSVPWLGASCVVSALGLLALARMRTSDSTAPSNHSVSASTSKGPSPPLR